MIYLYKHLGITLKKKKKKKKLLTAQTPVDAVSHYIHGGRFIP